MQNYVLPLDAVSLDDLNLVGGKTASLGEMVRSLKQVDVEVPDGFALTVAAYLEHLRSNGLEDSIYSDLDQLDIEDIRALSTTAAAIRERIENAPLPADVAAEAKTAYAELSAQTGDESTDVAVRSSATAEDLPGASFAGQQETYLNVRGWADLDLAIRRCMASLFTDRAITYRAHQGIAHRDVSLSVCVQKMIRSDRSVSGVMFTLDTESGARNVVLINAAYGLGELVVQGRVNPDEFWIHKPTLEAGFRPIIARELGEKRRRLIYAADDRGCVEVDVSSEERERFTLTDDEVLELARMGLAIERHYSERAGHPVPMDIEWAKDGNSGRLFILQARPETVHSSERAAAIEVFDFKTTEAPLLRGKSVGARVGVGRVNVIRSAADLEQFEDGDVLVAEMTDPDWEPVLERAAAVVTERGGRTCHAAIVSREHGIPCVVGTDNATRVLEPGQTVTVSCAEGTEGRIYAGALPFERTQLDLDGLPESPVPLMLNLADPNIAFQAAQLPSAGVGLLRIEFLISGSIGIHPLALLTDSDGRPDARVSEEDWIEIQRRTKSHASPTEYFIERLASGIARVAAAFYPRPVLVRFSDFKTNEYARLLGGLGFEPKEANPMLGFRGASRY